jgi:hypothetical protein
METSIAGYRGRNWTNRLSPFASLYSAIYLKINPLNIPACCWWVRCWRPAGLLLASYPNCDFVTRRVRASAANKATDFRVITRARPTWMLWILTALMLSTLWVPLRVVKSCLSLLSFLDNNIVTFSFTLASPTCIYTTVAALFSLTGVR